MTTKEVQVFLPEGLEARRIAELVQIASSFDSRIYIVCGEKKVNAKSIMGMMSLELREGDSIIVEADGEDEEKVIEGIRKLCEAS